MKDYPEESSVEDMLYIDGYDDAMSGIPPISHLDLYMAGYNDAIGDIELGKADLVSIIEALDDFSKNYGAT